MGGTGLEPVTPSLSNSFVVSAADADRLRKPILSRDFFLARTAADLRRNAPFCAPGVGCMWDGVVARFANGQRLLHLGCICVSACLGFVVVA